MVNPVAQPRLQLPKAPTHTRFVTRGTRYVWSEGDALMTHKRVLRDPAKRARAFQLFAESLVPNFEKRGIQPTIVSVNPRASVAIEEAPTSTLRWMAWSDPNDETAPIWALFADTVVGNEVALVDNDTSRCIAWGDGPVLAWADEDPTALGHLREALLQLPLWLRSGLHSMDAVFPVQIAVDFPSARQVPVSRQATEQASMPVRRVSQG